MLDECEYVSYSVRRISWASVGPRSSPLLRTKGWNRWITSLISSELMRFPSVAMSSRSSSARASLMSPAMATQKRKLYSKAWIGFFSPGCSLRSALMLYVYTSERFISIWNGYLKSSAESSIQAVTISSMMHGMNSLPYGSSTAVLPSFCAKK